MNSNPLHPCNPERYICAGENGMYAGTIEDQMALALTNNDCPVEDNLADVYATGNTAVYVGGWFTFQPDVSQCSNDGSGYKVSQL